tara:strand:- start:9866 stop:10132 length:267 start_codon:yes stop_codon:yes gene_type:complete
MTTEEVNEFLEEKLGKDAEEVILVDNFDRAFIGASLDPPKAIYSIDLCINTLTNQGMSLEDAEEYFWKNTMAASEEYECSPIFIHTVI